MTDAVLARADGIKPLANAPHSGRRGEGTPQNPECGTSKNFKTNEIYFLFNSSTISAGFAVISTHAGIKPLLTAFLTERIFDQAEQ